MKKFFCLFLCLLTLVSLASCKKEPEPEPEPEPELTFANQNPLTGEYYANPQEFNRPFAVSINNIYYLKSDGSPNYDYYSWPQYGTSEAEIVFEMETEGGITRMMCVFSDPGKAERIGSVRSMRMQLLEGVFQWNVYIFHDGISIHCEEKMLRDDKLNTIHDRAEKYLFKDTERAKTYSKEHCMFTNAELLNQSVGDKTAWQKPESANMLDPYDPTKTAFNFAKQGETAILSGGPATTITYLFSKEYDGDFRYDAASGKYLKFQHGEAHIDGGNNKQLEFENVILLTADIFTVYGTIYDGLIYCDYEKGGKGYYFNGGTYEEISWSKASAHADFSFKKADGSPLVVNIGRTHLGIIRDTNMDSIKISG